MALTHHPLDRLRAKFPSWLIVRTGSGRLWAWAKLTIAQRRAGCRGSLRADTVDELEKQLWEQSAKRSAVGR